MPIETFTSSFGFVPLHLGLHRCYLKNPFHINPRQHTAKHCGNLTLNSIVNAQGTLWILPLPNTTPTISTQSLSGV